MYALKKQTLGLLEQQSEAGHINLLYADETRVSEEGYVPYGWQFAGEDVHIEAARGASLNCFGMISRNNELVYSTTTAMINADYIVGALDAFSLKLSQPTVVVMDNARVHTAGKVKACMEGWQSRGLYIFFLLPYSPQLNIAERLWKELKGRWLAPKDYKTPDTLFYATNLALMAVGKALTINFSAFKV